MKYVCFFLISFILCISACKKANEEVVVNDGLIGKWQLIKWAVGIGNGTFSYYYPDPKKPQMIEFMKDSSFTANINSTHLKNYSGYGILNSRDIKFLPDLSSTPPNTWSYKTSDGTNLKLYMHIVCIEGCFYEYQAIK